MAFDPKFDFDQLSRRLTELTSRLEESARKQRVDKATEKGFKFFESAFKNLGDLLTRGVTQEGIRNLLRHEARETLRFYSRDIDFEALKPLPWYKRYPVTAWKLFVATAYRLSPPRRIAFAIATFAFLLGSLEMLLALTQPRDLVSAIFWWFVALVLYTFLLLMELRDKLDLKSDLEVAREIQIALVPSRPYHLNTITIHSYMRPANTVGGDYHDIVDLGGGKIAVMTGDVAGKGMPAALMMALLQGSLRTLLTAGLRGTELVGRLNQYLFDNIPSNKLVTLFYGELDTGSGDFHYVNAGHNAPFLLSRGSAAQRMPATSLVLGVLRDAEFEALDIRLNPGQKILLFTDGVNEVFNEKEEEYGEERMEAFLQKHMELPDQDLIQGLVRDVLAFCEGSRPGDDMTLMCISMKEQAPAGQASPPPNQSES